MKLLFYLQELQKGGRLHFTLEEAAEATHSSKAVVSAKLYHFKKKGSIISPLKGLYIIIPWEDKARGSLEAGELVAICMKYLNIPYYVGLLTAARHHGATHQSIFVFQVVSNKRIKKEIRSGDTRIQFIYKKDIDGVKTEERAVRTGYLRISTPEETAKDIMTYREQVGGLNHQATLLSELIPSIDPKILISLAEKSKSFFWLQRIGYILEHIDTFYTKERDGLVKTLEKFFLKQKTRYTPLSPEMEKKNSSKNKKWKIIENSTVESDI